MLSGEKKVQQKSLQLFAAMAVDVQDLGKGGGRAAKI